MYTHPDAGTIKDPKHRTVVCSHWLVGLCQNGSDCSFLHRLDKSKMPKCRYGRTCKIKNCLLAHVEEEEKQECPYFRQGFCLHGPHCKYRHVKRSPDELPEIASFDLCIIPNGAGQMVISSTIAGGTNGNAQPVIKKVIKKIMAGTGGGTELYKISLCKYWLEHGSCPFNEGCHYAHGEIELNEVKGTEDLDDYSIYDPTRNLMTASKEIVDIVPYPNLVVPTTGANKESLQSSGQNSKVVYFLLQAPDLRSLVVARRRNVWQIPIGLINEMNQCYRLAEHVILFFSVRSLLGIYGVARMEGEVQEDIDSLLRLPGTAGGKDAPTLSGPFPIRWLRSLRISLKLVSQPKTGLGGVSIGRTTADGRLDFNSGNDILLMAYRKVEWDWAGAELMKASTSKDIPMDYIAKQYQTMPPDVLFPDDWKQRAAQSSSIFLNPPALHALTQAVKRRSVPTGDYYTGDAPGFMFLVEPTMVPEIFHKRLLGMPSQLRDMAYRAIAINAPLFFFDTGNKTLFGLYSAMTAVQWNIDPMLFVHAEAMKHAKETGGTHPPPPPLSTTPYPAQLRFTVVLDAMPVPETDPEVMNVFGPSKPIRWGPLSLKDTKALANLFARICGVLPTAPPPHVPGPPAAPIPPAPVPPGQPRGGGPRGVPSSAGSVPPPPPPSMDAGGGYRGTFRCNGQVPIDIPHPSNHILFELRRRLVGQANERVFHLIKDMGGQQRVRLRLRGQGSGFKEGPNQLESPEPLHFHISTDTEDNLRKCIDRIKEHIGVVRYEMQANGMA